jgi:beta-lactamase regulating signal transducer with metallopeptidase domain
MIYALNVIAVSALLAAAAWLATRGSRSARERHAIWTGALFAAPVAAAVIFAIPVTRFVSARPEQAVDTSPWPILWAIGSCFLAFRLGSSYVRLLVLKRHDGVTLSDERIRQLRLRSGTTRPLRVVISPHSKVPQFAGLGSAVILIPAQVGSKSAAADVDTIILHELIHANAYHDVLRALQEVIVAAFFFSPFIHLLARRADLERELVADVAAARVIGGAEDYAASLARVVLSGTEEILAPGINGRSLLCARLRHLLDSCDLPATMRPRRFAAAAAMSLLLLAAASPFLPHRVIFELVAAADVPAPQADDEAAGHYGSGLSLYWSGHYAEAAHEFSIAFEDGYEPALAADGVATSYAALGDDHRAAFWRARTRG